MKVQEAVEALYQHNPQAVDTLCHAITELRAALDKIRELNRYDDSDEPNEWGDAECFGKAQSIAHKAIERHDANT